MMVRLGLVVTASLWLLSGLTHADNLVAQHSFVEGFNSANSVSDPCIGAIKLTTRDTVHTISSSEGEVRYRNFGRVETVTVEGNCCWRVAKKRNHMGRTRDFMEAVNDVIHGEKVKSVMKIYC